MSRRIETAKALIGVAETLERNEFFRETMTVRELAGLLYDGQLSAASALWHDDGEFDDALRDEIRRHSPRVGEYLDWLPRGELD